MVLEKHPFLTKKLEMYLLIKATGSVGRNSCFFGGIPFRFANENAGVGNKKTRGICPTWFYGDDWGMVYYLKHMTYPPVVADFSAPHHGPLGPVVYPVLYQRKLGLQLPELPSLLLDTLQKKINWFG